MFGGCPISNGGNGVSVPTRSVPSVIVVTSPPVAEVVASPPPSSSSSPHPATNSRPSARTSAAAMYRSRDLLMLKSSSPLCDGSVDVGRKANRSGASPPYERAAGSPYTSCAHARADAQSPVRRPLRKHHRGRRQHAAGRAAAPVPQTERADLREARGAQPDRLGQGPGREGDDGGRRGRGGDRARADGARADLGQHRDRAGDDLP